MLRWLCIFHGGYFGKNLNPNEFEISLNQFPNQSETFARVESGFWLKYNFTIKKTMNYNNLQKNL